MCGIHLKRSRKSPLLYPDTCKKTIFQECGPDKGTTDAYKLEVSQSFVNCIFLGGMMYVEQDGIKKRKNRPPLLTHVHKKSQQ